MPLDGAARPAWRLAALAGAVGVALLTVGLLGGLSADGMRDRVDGFGAAAPVVFVAASAALTVACFPGPLLAGASGLLFGTAAGFPLTLTATALGASAAFWIARTVGHDEAARRVEGRARAAAVRTWVGERGFLSVLYARIAPGVPYNLVNYAGGLSPVTYRAFLAATIIGWSPRAFAYTALGGSFGDLGRPETVVAIGVLVAMAAGGLLLARRQFSASASARTVAASPDPAPAGPGTATSSPAAPTGGPR